MPRFVICVRCHSTAGVLSAEGLCEDCRSLTGQSARPTPHGDEQTSAPLPGPEDLTRTDPFADPRLTVSVGVLPVVALPPQSLTFANYELHELIGRGGMGVVYRATQKWANRVVALKVMAGALEFDDGLKKRFQTEAEAQARLQHPGIVPIYEVGEEDGRPFFSMEYVPGGSLARTIRTGSRPGPRESAGLAAAVARAVDAAHAQSVIHRDVKPSNILLTEDGTPKVTDFGLAVLADRDSRETHSGAMLGTPSYMAPEQAAGRKNEIGPPTDVYSIGATLYELLTGEPPFKAETNVATAVRVLNEDVVPPRKRNPEIPPELEAVCLKCLEKEPANRYTSAAALADDLDAWRDGKATVARPPTVVRRVGRHLRRHRAALAALVLLPLLAGAIYLGTRERDQKKAIEDAFAKGNEVILIGATGGPKWHKWECGEVAIDYTLTAEGAFAFQTEALTEVTLIENCQSDEYHVVAELCHVKAFEPQSYCGLYAYSGDIVRAGDVTLRRHSIAGYSDFRVPPYHGIKLLDQSVLSQGTRTLTSLATTHPLLPFPPNPNPNFPQSNLWRTVVLSATRNGLEAYWKTDTGYSLVPLPKAGVAEEARKKHRRDLVQQFKADLPEPPVWVPRGAVGLVASSGTAAFRNLVIKPGPFVAP